MSALSVIIITKNEAENITLCLESVKFADEIIVLDSGSTDETRSLALKYTPCVFDVDWPGYGIQKNRALQKAKYDWVLSIDADEIVTPELQREIIEIVKQNNFDNDAFLIPRKSKYCDQFVYHGDWKNDHCIRLFRRLRARFTELPVHEGLEVSGKVGNLRGTLLHNSFSNLEEVLYKINTYSTLSAQHKFNQGKKSSVLKAIGHGLWTFFRGYFLKLGFLDGKRGLLLAISNAEGCYYRYIKLMLLHENNQ